MRAAIRTELYADSMGANLPVKMIVGLFKMRQDRDGDVKFGQFVGSDWTESGILESAAKDDQCLELNR